MADNQIKFIILGLKHRGLWLASQLAKKGFDVTWMDLVSAKISCDDLPWQVGETRRFKELPATAQDFLETCFKTKTQKGLQIITPQGPFEFEGPFFERGLKFFFKDSYPLLLQYFAAVNKGDVSLISAIEKKLSKLPMSKRWILEWKSRGDYMFFSEDYSGSLPACVELAEKAGVKVLRDAKILDVGMEGSRVTGVEVEDVKGFRACDQLILSCPSSAIQNARIKNNAVLPAYVWVKYQFEVKPESKPVGLYGFSSFVLDPCMRLEGSQYGLLEWRADRLNVWVKLDFEEAKKESILQTTGETLKKSLTQLISGFEPVKMTKIDADISEVKNKYIYAKDSDVMRGLYKKNLWFAGPETDLRSDLISSFETEENIFDAVCEKYLKEKRGPKKNDRKIHQSPHGQAVVD